MPSLKQIVERADTKAGRTFQITVQLLIGFSLVTFSIETLPNLSPSLRWWLWVAEVATVAIFTLEYLLRLYVADKRFGYVFSFFGLVDLLAILPFYISTGIDLRAIRAFRLVRMFRLLKLARYSKAIQRFHRAFLLAKEEVALFFFATVILIYVAAVGIYYFERDAQPEAFGSVFHSLWWAVATLTTVGYGDIYPITVGGRIFTFVLLMIGLGIVAVPAGLVTSALTRAREFE
jgi:voltage-gated potassium channel